MASSIHFILTGGTIDKIYDPVSQSMKMAEISCVPDYLNSVFPNITPTFETLCMLDSRDFTDEIRNNLIQTVLKNPASRIVILHGTDTMPATAAYLHSKISSNSGKTVILTGALIPLKEFNNSDGGFNLGFATAAVQMLEPGVYITMNATIFKAGEVEKNLKTARFEETKSKKRTTKI